MVFIGDYFALGLVGTLFIFFLDTKIGMRHMSSAGKLFILCLISTALTAVVDLITIQMMRLEYIPLWQNVLANSLYFLINIVTTSSIALYLFTKILEHTHDRHCMKNACIGLTVLFILYLVVIAANLWTGWLFYFEEGIYHRGPLNSFGYVITFCQLALVLICYIRNRRNASRPICRVLLQMSPIIPLCLIIHRLAPDLMLNAFGMAMVDTVLFLSFQGQRQGVHSLTRLNDRHRFFAEITDRIRQKEPFQVFLINIKNFSAINQKYGHIFGDEYLYQFAFAMEKLLKGSLSFHMNGTVFAMILRYTYQDTAEKQSGALLDFLEQGIRCGGEQINANYIMVHYVSDGQESSAAELYETLEHAAEKAYNLKHHYIHCTREITEEMLRKRYLRERIQKVDREHGFDVWFQPIRCRKTGNYSSMEALIRLHEADGKMISPAEFIPQAEQMGNISSVTWFVLEEVCRLLKQAPELEHVSVSVNLPMSQLLEKGFVPHFVGIVDQMGIDHRRICIEFTERAILENFQRTLGVMEQLTRDGFRFYLDDFGEGYSNFHCLLQLPFQIIKLDKCLVQLDQNGKPDYTMVHTLTKLFHDRNLVVIAEGAETEQEVAALEAQNIDRVQGYALAKPMPTDRLLEFYREHPVTI